MATLSREELARRCGIGVERVDWLVDLGILALAEGFTLGDLQRVRLVDALEQAGIPPDAVARAMREGHVSLGFADVILADPVSLSSTTYGDLARDLGMDEGLFEETMSALGLPLTEPTDLVPEDDLQIANLWRATAGLDRDAVTRTARVYGESLLKIAEAENRFWESEIEAPMVRAGLSAQEIIDLGAQAGLPLQAIADELVRVLHRRHLHRYAMQTYVRRLAHAMEEAGVLPRTPERPEAIGFLDLSGFTRLTEAKGDEAAAALGRNLASLVQRVSRAHGGRLVKLLGDGAMLYFSDPGEAVLCALDLVDAAPALSLPAVRVGIHAGPVIRQDGDYYGRTVNIASRVLDQAEPGEVLVTGEVVDAAADDPVSFEAVGASMLKSFDEPVELHRARRSGPMQSGS